MTTLYRIGAWLAGANRAASAAGVLFVVLMVAHITIDVALRYLFNAPPPGTILFVSVFYMTAVAFLPLAFVEERESHIAVELLYDRFAHGARRLLSLFSLALSTLVFGALFVRTLQEATAKTAVGSFQMEAGFKIPTWPSYYLLPIGFGLMALVAFYKLLCLAGGARSGLRPDEPIAGETGLSDEGGRGG